MLRKEKSLSIRETAYKKIRSKFIHRYSAIDKKKYSTLKVKSIHNYSFKRVPPPILFTMPNNKRLTSGMGNNIEREQLYENNMQLKESLNKLKRELAETKNNVNKKKIELKKKEKIISECLKEKDLELNHESTIEKAKESALLTKCKDKYNVLKNSYQKEIEENKILKANIKITKIKEFQIENDILNKELIKLRAMYLNCKKTLKKYKDDRKDLKNFKIKFLEQHSIISSYIQKCDLLNEEIRNLKEERDDLLRQLQVSIQKREKLKQSNDQLRIKNIKYMNQKKLKEHFEYLSSDKKGLLKYKKDAYEFKRAFNQKIVQYNDLNQKYDLCQKKLDNYDLLSLKLFQYKNIKDIEQENNPKEIDKIELYKSLYDESQNKNLIYEKYLKEININPKDIIKKYGHSGVRNTENKLLVKNSEIKNSTKSNNENNENIIMKNNDIKQEDILSNKNIVEGTNNFNKKSGNDNDDDDDDEEEEEINDKKSEQPDPALIHSFLKNFEVNHITHRIFKKKMKSIVSSFKGIKGDSKENYLSPFYQLFFESMKVKQEKDKQIIKNFLNDIFDSFKGDVNKLSNQLNDFFQDINDYSSLTNDKEEQFLDELAFHLKKYKNNLEKKIKKYYKNDTVIINYDGFMEIIKDLNISLNKDLMEFLLYKMKSTVPENYSIFDFNCKIILDLLNREIENSEDKENNNNNSVHIKQSLHLSKLLSKKFEDIKKKIKEIDFDFDVAFKNEIEYFHNEKNSYEIIEKDKFFEIMENNGIKFNKETKEEIYKLFKNEEYNNKKKGKEKILKMDFKKLKNLFKKEVYYSTNDEQE